VTKLRAR